MRAIRLVMAACATIGILPTVATASTVSVDASRSTAVFRSGAGPSDVTTTDLSAPFWPASSFTDAAQPLKAGAGCLAGVPVWCQARNQDVRLGAGDDRFRGFSGGGDTTVTGGEGNDDISANGIRSIVSGGGGADTISVGSNGYSYANGNAGDDRIRSIAGGIEASLSGGPGDDLLYGDRPSNILDGGDGDDDLIVTRGSGSLNNPVNGGDGADTLLVIDDTPRYTGPRTLSGGGGADTIVAGPLAFDAVSGGSGDDTIDVSGDERTDPRPDTVDCGAGRDTVYADDTDVIAKNCETRLAGPMPTSAAAEQALSHLGEAFGPLGAS